MSSVETKNGRDEKNKKIFSSGELNGTKSLQVGFETRKRVLAVAEQLNYRPRSLNGKTCIAIIIGHGRMGTYETLMLGQISRLLQKENALIQILPFSEAKLLDDKLFSGALAIVHGADLYAELGKLNERMPLICINGRRDDFDTVFSDENTGIPHAMKYLFDKGHRRIGAFFVDGLKMSSIVKYRLDLYKRFVKEHNLDFDERLLQFLVNHGPGPVETVAKMLKAKPTAIIACGESLHHHINYGLHMLDKKVPDDISLLAYEDSYSWLTTPPLTTIGQDFERIAELAVGRMLETIKGKRGGRICESVPYIFTERDSVRKI